jgi:hypothetical protein
MAVDLPFPDLLSLFRRVTVSGKHIFTHALIASSHPQRIFSAVILRNTAIEERLADSYFHAGTGTLFLYLV